MSARALAPILVALAAAGAQSAPASADATFTAGAAVESFAPPAAGQLATDPADCLTALDTTFTGTRLFAFEEPYSDQQGSGHYDFGDPYVDCNHNGRWDG